jgi:two-component system, sensor histidine kinase
MLDLNREKLKARSYRVLIVDDHPDTIEVLSALFAMLGHQTRGTRYGREALVIARDFDPDLILLDIQLPDITGYDVVRELRGDLRLSGCYIAAVTGWGRPSDIVRALAHGFDQHLTKPFDVASLRQMLGLVSARKHELAERRLRN